MLQVRLGYCVRMARDADRNINDEFNEYVNSIGVISGRTGGPESHFFWNWRTDPPLYKYRYTKSEILLGALTF